MKIMADKHQYSHINEVRYALDGILYAKKVSGEKEKGKCMDERKEGKGVKKGRERKERKGGGKEENYLGSKHMQGCDLP